MSSPVMINRPNVRIVLAPVWPYFFWGFLLITLMNISLSAVNLYRPCWTRLRAGMRLASDLAGSALFCWLLKAHVLAEITAANVPAARTLEITNAFNLWAGRAFPIAVVAGVAIVGFDVFRMVRVKAKSIGLSPEPTAMQVTGDR